MLNLLKRLGQAIGSLLFSGDLDEFAYPTGIVISDVVILHIHPFSALVKLGVVSKTNSPDIILVDVGRIGAIQQDVSKAYFLDEEVELENFLGSQGCGDVLTLAGRQGRQDRRLT